MDNSIGRHHVWLDNLLTPNDNVALGRLVDLEHGASKGGDLDGKLHGEHISGGELADEIVVLNDISRLGWWDLDWILSHVVQSESKGSGVPKQSVEGTDLKEGEYESDNKTPELAEFTIEVY